MVLQFRWLLHSNYSCTVSVSDTASVRVCVKVGMAKRGYDLDTCMHWCTHISCSHMCSICRTYCRTCACMFREMVAMAQAWKWAHIFYATSS